jgi:outer membrane lipoprotein SlyB
MDTSGRVVIPRGSDAELILRDASKNEIVLDLESVNVNGRRYVVNSAPETISSDGTNHKEGVGANKRTAKYVGGGALVGSIIGAIAGGGKGAAIGAATGAGAGAIGQTVTRGGSVRLPSESLVTFRLDQPMVVGAADSGFTRDGRHYHRYDRQYSR